MSKVLVSPSSFGQCGLEPVQLLKDNGYEIVHNPFGRKLTEDEVIKYGEGCIGIVAGVEPLTAKVIDALPDLKCISRVGVGMDNVDIIYANSKGISVVNTPDGPTRAVAELTVGLVFAVLRRISQADANMKQKVWKKETGNLLFGKTIGVVGLGRIGRLVAELFKSIGNTVIGFDPFPNKEWAAVKGVKLVDFSILLTTADIITLHVPPQTNKQAIIGKEEFGKIKNGAFLINASRGGVVDEQQLYAALTNGKLTAAAADVFEKEPYQGPLCDLPNIVLTPHLGSYAEEGKLLMEIDAVKNLINRLK